MKALTLLSASFILTAVLTAILSRLPWALAKPNERSLHQRPIPATGGLAILVAVAVTWGYVWMSSPPPTTLFWEPVWAAIVVVAVFSLVDDYYGLPALARLIAHCFAAYLIVVVSDFALQRMILPGGSIWISAQWLGWVGTFLFVVWLINLYNFMDGMDGFASGMAVFGFGTFALLGVLQDSPQFAVSNGLLAMAGAGFLLFNFPPARIFMGDAGATALGLCVAISILWADRLDVFPPWVGVLVFSPFIVDATATLLQRLLRGEKIWQAHRRHAYQCLAHNVCWGHRKTVLWEYGLMALCGLSALLAVWKPALQIPIAVVWALNYIGLWVVVQLLSASSLQEKK